MGRCVGDPHQVAKGFDLSVPLFEQIYGMVQGCADIGKVTPVRTDGACFDLDPGRSAFRSVVQEFDGAVFL